MLSNITPSFNTLKRINHDLEKPELPSKGSRHSSAPRTDPQSFSYSQDKEELHLKGSQHNLVPRPAPPEVVVVTLRERTIINKTSLEVPLMSDNFSKRHSQTFLEVPLSDNVSKKHSQTSLDVPLMSDNFSKRHSQTSLDVPLPSDNVSQRHSITGVPLFDQAAQTHETYNSKAGALTIKRRATSTTTNPFTNGFRASRGSGKMMTLSSLL